MNCHFENKDMQPAVSQWGSLVEYV